MPVRVLVVEDERNLADAIVRGLRRKGMAVDDVRTVIDRDASAERAGTYRLAARLQVSGDLTDAQIEELEAVAAKCPVHKLMTSVTTEITTAVERMP